MAEAGQVNSFLTKMKAHPAKVALESVTGEKAGFTCTVTLPAVFTSGEGIPEMQFTDGGKNKKAAKAAAMKQAFRVLVGAVDLQERSSACRAQSVPPKQRHWRQICVSTFDLVWRTYHVRYRHTFSTYSGKC